MNKTKKISLITSLGVIGVASLVPALSFASTSCSSNGTFDTTNFSMSKYEKYVQIDEDGRKCLMIPNGTINVNINLILNGDIRNITIPFDSIVIPDSVINISVNLYHKIDENGRLNFNNFFYGNSINNKKTTSNSNQIEQFLLCMTDVVIKETKLNLPINFKESTNSKFSLSANSTSFPSTMTLDFSNYTKVRDFSLSINKKSSFAASMEYDGGEECLPGYIYFPKTIYSDSKFYVNFSGSYINANIVLPENLETINQDMFGSVESGNWTRLGGHLIIPASVTNIPDDLLKHVYGCHTNFTLTFESAYLFQKYRNVLKTENSFLPFNNNGGEINFLCPWTLDLSPIDKSYWDSNISFKKTILTYLASPENFNGPFSYWFAPNGPNGGQGEELVSTNAQKMLDEMNSNTGNNYT